MPADGSIGSKEELGNTESNSSKRSSPCIKYVFTLNNYTEEELEMVPKVLDTLGNYVFGQEIGEQGTPHLQGWLRLKTKMRITQLKSIKGLERFHWEQQRGTDAQAIQYCLKDNKYHSNIPVKKFLPPRPLKIISELYPWQKELEDIVKHDADERSVYWIWETKGNVGKSTFCKYLCHKYNATYIDEGKKSDLINIIYNIENIDETSIIVIDVPRNNGNNVSYKAIEQIKNGIICNTKYETGMKLFNSPHIIIFSNYFPETCNLSKDRWKIGMIDDKKIVWNDNLTE